MGSRFFNIEKIDSLDDENVESLNDSSNVSSNNSFLMNSKPSFNDQQNNNGSFFSADGFDVTNHEDLVEHDVLEENELNKDFDNIVNDDNGVYTEQLDINDNSEIIDSEVKDPYVDFSRNNISNYADEDVTSIKPIFEVNENETNEKIDDSQENASEGLMEYNSDFFANNSKIDFNSVVATTEPVINEEKKAGWFSKKNKKDDEKVQKNNFIQEEIVQEPQKEEVRYNPLNNGSNPIPVNPVAPVEEIIDISYDEGKVNIFTFFGMVLGMIIKPGRTVEKSLNSYQQLKSGILITIFVAVFALLLYLIPRLYLSGYTQEYNIATGSYYSVYKVDLIFQQNFVQLILSGLLFSTFSILFLSLIYYATSFFSSIGVNFTKLLVLFNLCFVPFLIGGFLLYPLVSLINNYVGLGVLVVSLLYSIITMFVSLSHALLIRSSNKEIYYNMFNISLYIIIMVIIYILFNGTVFLMTL